MDIASLSARLALDPMLVAAGLAVIAAALLGGVIALIVFLVLRARRRRADSEAQALAAEARMLDLARLQTETAGRIQAMGELLAGRQSDLARVLNDRLDAVTNRLGQSMQNTTQQTTDNLQKLNERLAVIDAAQHNITQLASQVTSLQNVLTNKQQRGAFGQGRMEMIIQDGLAKGTYEFQFTLSNRTRPDCAIFFPDQRPLIIDAKFPLEAVTAFRDAKSDDERAAAAKLLRQGVAQTHFRHCGQVSAAG